MAAGVSTRLRSDLELLQVILIDEANESNYHLAYAILFFY
jgi:hypothetical protein